MLYEVEAAIEREIARMDDDENFGDTTQDKDDDDGTDLFTD